MKRANNKQDILQSLWSLGEPELAASLESMLREGIMDDGSVREIIAMKQKQKVLAIHSYAVGQMKGNDTRWYTYVIDSDTGKRKKVVAPTEAELYRNLRRVDQVPARHGEPCGDGQEERDGFPALLPRRTAVTEGPDHSAVTAEEAGLGDVGVRAHP